MFMHEIDRLREQSTSLIEKRRRLEAQGHTEGDQYGFTLVQIAATRRLIENGLAERRANPLADLSERIGQWIVKTFGLSNLTHRGERAMRIVEEAIEVAQAEGLPSTVVEAIVARVYSRPVGTRENEIAGLLLTVAAWQANTPSMIPAFGEAEKLLAHLEGADPFLFRGKHLAKVEAGVGLPGIPPGPPPVIAVACPAEATGNPVDCGGCPEHAAPACAVRPPE